MEKLSRVKKYEDLRKSIETENAVGDPARDALKSEQQEAFKKFDSSILKKVTISDDDYIPGREKADVETNDASVVDDTFTNEYLDDFIREVREYNIKKGNRESDDTQIDILSQLNAANRAKRAHYVENIEEPATSDDDERKVVSREAIAQEVANLLNEETLDVEPEEEILNSETTLDDDIYATTELILENDSAAVSELPVKESVISSFEEVTQPLTKEPAAKKILQPQYDIGNTDLYGTGSIHKADEEDKNTLHKKLMEETQQLRVQMDEYEDELTDLSDGVEKNNKILNFILCFLILVLLVIIGFIGYYIWKGGNF